MWELYLKWVDIILPLPFCLKIAEHEYYVAEKYYKSLQAQHFALYLHLLMQQNNAF